jgi:hypothetical protein
MTNNQSNLSSEALAQEDAPIAMNAPNEHNDTDDLNPMLFALRQINRGDKIAA